MMDAMPRLLYLTACLLPGVPLAAIGDPCDEEGQCTPGLVCSTDEDGTMYCTGRCPEAGCPEGYFCRDTMGLRVCERGLPPVPVGFGETCGADSPCDFEQGLFCSCAPPSCDERVCTRRCTGPATCPQGWSCRGLAGEDDPDAMACAQRDGPAGFTDLCDDGEPRCAEGLVCAAFPDLGEICTQACDAGNNVCGRDFVCDGAACAPPAQMRAGIGGACNPGADDEGCAAGLRCFVDGDDAYCTGPCNMAGACPPGFGCVEQQALMGECRRGVPDDAVFDEGGTVDPNDIPDPPPPMPRADMGTAAADGGEDDGCGCGQTGGTSWFALLLIAGRLRRRDGPGSRPNTAR